MMNSEIAWAAGLFEGEGSMSITYSSTPKGSVQMNLVSTDHDVIEHFANVVEYHTGVSVNLTFVESKNPRHRSHWVWWACGRNAKRVITLLQPWFGERRSAKAQECLDHIAQSHRFGCQFCEKELVGAQRKFCSTSCRQKYGYHKDVYHSRRLARRRYHAKRKV